MPTEKKIEKTSPCQVNSSQSQAKTHKWALPLKVACIALASVVITLSTYGDLSNLSYERLRSQYYEHLTALGWARTLPYGRFPGPGDPFHFLPCTNATLPPPIDDPDPERTWARLFDPDPDHWSWGGRTDKQDTGSGGKYDGRSIYLCGYLDVPLDYTNQSDSRIARLAVTKLQVTGLSQTVTALEGTSERTIVIEPGGPGGSGTSYVWRAAEEITNRLSDGKYDVLGWDPRGVNASLPAVACYPYNADRDRWSLLTGQYYEVSGSPAMQLEVADAMADAVFRACWEKYGDLGRFVTTAFVARDLEEIRKAIGEDELTAYLVSYGTGIGQTYANMFPHSIGRVILDGTEYVRDHRLLAGFGWTALDNVTDAWHDGFLGECVNAGSKHCSLARSIDGSGGEGHATVQELEDRMGGLMKSLIQRPVPGYSEKSGPSLVTYSSLVNAIYSALYTPSTWPALAQMLSELEDGNSTLATIMLEKAEWEYDPTLPSPPSPKPSSDELGTLVICSDAYDAAEPPEGLAWWGSLWANMTSQSWIAGNSRFFNVFPCRHFTDYWPEPAEVYRHDLNHTLKNPILLIAETYDPATPLRNGRRLLKEMGSNARLIAHHGYGHSSGRDRSNCTDAIARRFILTGKLPEEPEVACHADKKPYLYGVESSDSEPVGFDPVAVWEEHLWQLA
ncbi:Alpha/Beta hydrolase protein [Poronia punctata]|nr:Alpha/Beta hydrolase protein [Poronia punctata]